MATLSCQPKGTPLLSYSSSCALEIRTAQLEAECCSCKWHNHSLLCPTSTAHRFSSLYICQILPWVLVLVLSLPCRAFFLVLPASCRTLMVSLPALKVSSVAFS